MADVVVERHGVLWLLRPITDGAERWVQRHVEFEEYQRVSGGIVVHHRFTQPIVEAMRKDGLDVAEGADTRPGYGYQS